MENINTILKTNTAELHKKLEQIGFVDKIFNKSLTLEEYKKLILANYIFHLPLEENLKKISENTNWNIQWKIPFLEKDRVALGNFAIPEIENTFIPKDLYEALGCLYVLEGATLGGRVIKRQLETLPVQMHYYGCYGEDNTTHWKNFMQLLSTHVDTESKAAIALSAAKQTFEFGIQCFELATIKL